MCVKNASNINKKKCHTSFQACGITYILWFSTHTYLHVNSAICGICVPYFAVSIIWSYTIGRHCMCWCMSRQKSMPHLFSVSPELIINLSIVTEASKSAWHRFFCAHTPTGGMSPYCIAKYPFDCEIWDLNSQYFIFYMQTSVWAEYTPKLGCVLRRHGFGWQIRNTGSLDPIFRSQTGLGTASGRGYRLFVPD